jgi:hypothetical protein
MHDDGHRRAPGQRPDDSTAERPSAMERHQREQSQFRNRPGGAPSAQYRAEGNEFFRDAIHRTYR